MADDQKMTEYTAIVHQDDDSCLWAEVEGLPGCFASGADYDELWEALAEAMSMCLSTPVASVMVRLKEPERIERFRIEVPA